MKGYKMIEIKSKREIELMIEACRITALVHKTIEENIKPGMTTLELDRMAEKVIRDNGGIPAQKGYPSGQKGIPDFPATICASVNDEVIHGIPSNRVKLKDGDIVSIDLVTYKNGYNGDAARTHIVGKASAEDKRLVEVTKKAFFEGIKFAKVGFRIGDISHAIQEYVEKNGFSIVKEFQGHGIGRQMHEDPGIPNYGKSGKGPKIEKGMTLAIEPMVIAGSPDIWELEDGWTIVSQDGTKAAHYENTILITENEPKVLTLY
jgi:methionyl aminopeptidase